MQYKAMPWCYAIGRTSDLRFIGGRFDDWPGHRRMALGHLSLPSLRGQEMTREDQFWLGRQTQARFDPFVDKYVCVQSISVSENTQLQMLVFSHAGGAKILFR